jgi:response regulator RpfG family c-di-GMP phosphodiesterase
MSRPVILVVDDEPLITNMLSMVLDLSIDAEILTTNSSPHAQEILRDGKISLLLTDYLMPQLNGLHLVRSMREEGNTIPVVLLTGYCDEPELAANTDFLKPFEVILKPWNNEDLVQRIKAKLR